MNLNQVNVNDLLLYRIVLVLSGILIPLFAMYSVAHPNAYNDPPVLRVILGLLLLVAGAGSYFIKPIKDNLKAVTYSLIMLTIVWNEYVLFLNNLAPRYVIVLLIAMVAYSFVFLKLSEFVIYIVSIFTLTTVVIFSVDNPESSALLTFGHLVFLTALSTLISFFLASNKKRGQQTTHLYKTMLDGITDAYYLLDQDLRLIRYNEKAREFFEGKLDHKLALGAYFPKLLSFEDKDEVDRSFETARSGKQDSFIRKYETDGNTYFRDITVTPILNENGEIRNVTITAQDISDRVKSERRMQQQQQLLQAVNTNVNEAIYRSSLSFGMIYFNRAFCKIFGYEEEDIKKLQIEDLYVRSVDRNKLIDVLTTQGEIKDFEVELKRKNGSKFWGSINAHSTLQEDGNLIIDGAIRDITSEKEIKTQLVKAEKALAAVNEANTLLLTEDNTQEAIKKSLELIGKAIKVDRAYLFENQRNEDGQLAGILKSSWASAKEFSYEDNKDVLAGVGYKELGLGRWIDVLQNNEMIVADVEDLPEQESSFLEQYQIKSIFVAPITVENSFYGYIGFEDCHRKKHWSDTLTDILQNLAYSISGAIKRKIAAEALNDAKIRAEEMSQLKSSFVARASHEIRTPINGIIGLTDVINQETANEEIKQYADLIRKNGEKLLASISSILNFTKEEATHENFHLIELDPVESIQGLLPLLKVLAEKKNIYLQFKKPEEQLLVRIDEVIFHQIVNNLIGNAVKFTDKGGVTISICKEGKYMKMEVKDTGIGITESFMERIFNPFEQEQNTKLQGSGLGLSIVKRYVELFEGSIKVESKKDVGAKFTVLLPLSKDDDK